MDFLKKLFGIGKRQSPDEQQSKPSVVPTDRAAATIQTSSSTSAGTLTVSDIMRLKREKDIKSLISALQYHDIAVRAEAVGSLGHLEDLQAVTPLISVLQSDSDPYVRSLAAEALGNLGDARARDALMHCLENDMHEVSLKATEALSKIQEPKDSQTKEDTIEISGEWMDQIWAEKPIVVFNDPDAANNFLSRDQLPYLWADIDGYVEKIDKNNNSQGKLRAEWTAAYLSHPNPKVVEITLKNHVTSDILNSWLVGAFLPELLAHDDPVVQEEAAKALWRNKRILKSVFGVLTGEYRGITSTAKNYLDRGVFKRKTESIVNVLRKNCPSDSKQLFEDIVRESFGPSYTEKGELKDTSEVQFKERINKTKMGVKMTYEVFTAPDKEVALTFLGDKEINEPFFYIIVETKDGNWGKDINGIFEE